MSDEPDVVTRPKRNPHKKTEWGMKSDKLNHGKKTARKRQLAEVEENDDDWKEYETR
jgi:hypothetical protein